jgi:lysozyme
MIRQRTSRKGRKFLAREEGLVPYAYNDPAGHATFGVGHLIHRGSVTAADRVRWGTRSRPKSRAYAMRVFRRDLESYEAAVRNAVGRRLRPYEFDACVSLAFNIGTGGFAISTVAAEIRKGRGRGNFARAADAFLFWDNPSILRSRRERERRLFLTGKYV